MTKQAHLWSFEKMYPTQNTGRHEEPPIIERQMSLDPKNTFACARVALISGSLK